MRRSCFAVATTLALAVGACAREPAAIEMYATGDDGSCDVVVEAEASGPGEWELEGGVLASRSPEGLRRTDAVTADQITEFLGRNRVRSGAPLAKNMTLQPGFYLHLIVRWKNVETGEVVAPSVSLTC